jgi:hypothetical protein
MRTLTLAALVLGLVALAPGAALAHCDAVDGPVATAARRALDTRNVDLILPFAPAAAEAELTAAFERAVVVREKGAEARALADRFFMETAVRLHRAGENAPYTGLQPAGTGHGPAIAAAEAALASSRLAPLLAFLNEEVGRAVTERFQQATASKAATAPTGRDGVAAARERVSAELAFVGYVEALYRATRGGGHVEGHVE